MYTATLAWVPEWGCTLACSAPNKLPGPVDGQLLHHVGKLAAPVVTATGVALRVLVGEHAAGGLQDGLAHEILRGNEFQLVGLTPGFPVDGVGNLRVDQRKASCEFGVDGHGGCPLKMVWFPERRTGEEPRQARHPGVQMLTNKPDADKPIFRVNWLSFRFWWGFSGIRGGSESFAVKYAIF